jgi:hypothetical protein
MAICLLEIAGFSAVGVLISSLCCGDIKEVAILHVAVFFLRGPARCSCVLLYQATTYSAAVATSSNTPDVVVPACAIVIDVAAAPTIAPSVTSVDDFISLISSDLCPPILTSPPRLRVSQVPDYSVVLRCSTRLADKPRASNPEVQAINVMLKKLGKFVSPPTTEDSGARCFHETFFGSLSPSTKEAMTELFPARKRLGSWHAAMLLRPYLVAILGRKNLSSCNPLYIPRSSLVTRLPLFNRGVSLAF